MYLYRVTASEGNPFQDRCEGMTDKPSSGSQFIQPTVYQFRIRVQLDPQWSDWFDGLTVSLEENGDTLLTGPVADQAALHGLLKKIRDLDLPLISVNQVPSTDSFGRFFQE